MSSKQSHIASFATKVKAIYSALVNDNAIMACFFKQQLTGPPLSMKMMPEVDLQLFSSHAQSESKYPCTNSSS